MEKRDAQIQKKGKIDYQIHSFGYGSDHDEKVLSSMREFKNGKFYYISSDEIVDECFIDCLSDIMTVIGKDVTIEINLTNRAQFVRVEEKAWQGSGTHQRTIKMSYLLSDQTNDYLCFLKLEPIDAIGPLKLGDCKMTYFDQKEKITKEKSFSIQVVEGEELGEINQEVEEAVQKAESKRVAKESKKLFT